MATKKQEYRKAYYAAHREKELAGNKSYREQNAITVKEGRQRSRLLNKEQKRQYMKAYYLAHQEEARLYARAYRAAHPEKTSACDKASKAAHADAIRAYRKAYTAAHCEERDAYNKAYYEKNAVALRKRSLVYGKAWRAANPERVKEYPKRDHARRAASARNKKKYAESPERFKEYVAKRRALKVGTQVEKIDFKQILLDSKGLCGICKKPFDLFGIDFDHIIPLARGGPHVTENLQATHSRCNRSKGAKVG